jgi:hypothetical protein
MLSPNLLCRSEPAFLPQHYHVVNVPISLTRTETVDPDLILFIDIHHQTFFGVSVEWALGTIPIFFDVLETNTKQRFSKAGYGIDVRCRFYVLVSKLRHWTSLVGFRCCLTISFSFLNINETLLSFNPH